MDGFEIIDPRFHDIVLPTAPLEKLAEGFRWMEGPVWFADLECLLFSDIPNNRVTRWTEAGGVEVFREPSSFENGHTRDREGRLISCSHRGRCITCTEIDGRITVLADRYQGKRLNNLTFGGRSRSQLFLCASHTLYAVYVNRRGAQYP